MEKKRKLFTKVTIILVIANIIISLFITLARTGYINLYNSNSDTISPYKGTNDIIQEGRSLAPGDFSFIEGVGFFMKYFVILVILELIIIIPIYGIRWHIKNKE